MCLGLSGVTCRQDVLGMCACLRMRVDKTRFSEDCEWCLENSLQQCLGDFVWLPGCC